MGVDWRQARPGVDEKEVEIGRANGSFGLRPHPAGKAVRRRLVKAGGIDGREGQIAEPGFALAPVAGHPRQVIDQRQLSPDQPVEQCRLADIRPADNRYAEGNWFSPAAWQVRPVAMRGPAPAEPVVRR